MAPIGQRLPRVLTAGADAVMCFELYDAGAPACGLAGAHTTALLRRTVTPPGAAELPSVPVVLDADAGTATLSLSGDETTMLAPSAGERVGEISIVVKAITDAGLIYFFGPVERELWAAAL